MFGAYATFLYLRTGTPRMFCSLVSHLVAPNTHASVLFVCAGHFVSIFIVHVFCNVMGFPDLSFFSPENSLHPFRKGGLATLRHLM